MQSEDQDDLYLYEIADQEWTDSSKRGLKIKYLTKYDGDENKAKARYIQARVIEIAEEENPEEGFNCPELSWYYETAIGMAIPWGHKGEWRWIDVINEARDENKTKLNLNNRKIIQKLTPFRNLKNLNELCLSRNKITDIQPLASLSKLVTLELETNLIVDISPVGNLTNLENLYLGDNKISDISTIGKLIKLKILSLSMNNINDITPLINLNNLHELRLSENYIHDFSPLSSLPSLRTLELINCKVSFLQKRKLKSLLPNVHILYDGYVHL